MPRRLDDMHYLQDFTLRACHELPAVRVRLAPSAEWTGTHTVTLYVQPTLLIARCNQ